MKTPCEVFVWYLLPGIRQELAKSMVKEYKLSQVQVAEKLGVTEAAVSQYLSGKRGEITLTTELKAEIDRSAGLIIEGDERTTVSELCRICSLVKDSDFMAELYEKHTGLKLE
ncbi:MAG: hypothetical protein AYK23_04390 [Candidatus Proteinoplasmatales archaeon SG8-5]|nr:MAG: hypothetical protein AYK23_04390 [Candidatus Proteinoplasmatales archaeon SG8-5]